MKPIPKKKDSELFYYKIAAKALAYRLMKTQNPSWLIATKLKFMKGRFVGDNIGQIEEVRNFAETKNIPRLFLFYISRKPLILTKKKNFNS